MAVVIYKDGESALVQPKVLQAHLENGWTLEKAPKKVEKKPKKSKSKEA